MKPFLIYKVGADAFNRPRLEGFIYARDLDQAKSWIRVNKPSDWRDYSAQEPKRLD